jgi:hypothetical protein
MLQRRPTATELMSPPQNQKAKGSSRDERAAEPEVDLSAPADDVAAAKGGSAPEGSSVDEPTKEAKVAGGSPASKGKGSSCPPRRASAKSGSPDGGSPSKKGGAKKRGTGKKASAKSRQVGGSGAQKIIDDAFAYSDAGQAQIPVSELTVVKTLEQHLGITMCNHPLGVLLKSVDPLDTAHEAGLRRGDVLIALNGRPVRTHQEAYDEIVQNAESYLLFTYYKASLAEADMLRRRTVPKLAVVSPEEGHTGLILTSHPLGLLCVDVVQEDLCFKAGLRPGDVIVTIGGMVILDHNDAVKVLDRDTAGFMVNDTGPIRLTYYPAAAAATELVVINSNFGVVSSATTGTSRSRQPFRAGKEATTAGPSGFSSTARTAGGAAGNPAMSARSRGLASLDSNMLDSLDAAVVGGVGSGGGMGEGELAEVNVGEADVHVGSGGGEGSSREYGQAVDLER